MTIEKADKLAIRIILLAAFICVVICTGVTAAGVGLRRHIAELEFRLDNAWIVISSLDDEAREARLDIMDLVKVSDDITPKVLYFNSIYHTINRGVNE